MAKLLRGTPLAEKIYKQIGKEVGQLSARYLTPQLDVILIGNDPSSVLYTSIKREKALQLGMRVKIHKLPAKVEAKVVLGLIEHLNQDKKVTGILVQMPIPNGISREKVIWAIAPEKDVDGFQMRQFLPPAPMAILEILRHYGYNLAKKKMLIIGKGFLIGKPLAVLATRHGARVSVADSDTPNLGQLVGEAQIVVAATGQSNLLSAEMVKPGQVVIDAANDIQIEAIKRKVEAVTPSPGGVGPLTVAMLLQNVVKAAKLTKSTFH